MVKRTSTHTQPFQDRLSGVVDARKPGMNQRQHPCGVLAPAPSKFSAHNETTAAATLLANQSNCAHRAQNTCPCITFSNRLVTARGWIDVGLVALCVPKGQCITALTCGLIHYSYSNLHTHTHTHTRPKPTYAVLHNS